MKTYGSSRAGSGNKYPLRQHNFETGWEEKTIERQVAEMTQSELSAWLRKAYPGTSQVSTGAMEVGQLAVWQPTSRDEGDMVVYEIRGGRPYCVTEGKYKELAEFGGVYDSQEQ